MQVVDSARLTMKKRNFSFVLLVLTFIIVNVASEKWNCEGSSLAGESTGKGKDTVQTEGNHTISVDECKMKTEIILSGNLKITGTGKTKTTLIAAGGSRHFFNSNSGWLILENLVLRGGDVTKREQPTEDPDEDIEFGAGGSILMYGYHMLKITSCSFLSNFALSGGAIFFASKPDRDLGLAVGSAVAS